MRFSVGSQSNQQLRLYAADQTSVQVPLSSIGASGGHWLRVSVIMDFTGAAGDWSEVFLTLPSIPAGGASFQFNYTAGGTFTGDIAIDDFCTL